MYFQCIDCHFIQTEEPYWLEEAYNSPIAKIDLGLIHRNQTNTVFIEELLLNKNFDSSDKFLDYGGGYGMFVRMMRDKGFKFYREDRFCENLFAEFFDITNLQTNTKFEALTAFEVFEHLQNPFDEVVEMLSYSDIIIFSTELQPDGVLNPSTWWYFVPETGQHISFYTTKSLTLLGKKLKLEFYSNGKNFHIFSKRKFIVDPFSDKRKNLLTRVLDYLSRNNRNKGMKRESLLQKDFDFIRQSLVK